MQHYRAEVIEVLGCGGERVGNCEGGVGMELALHEVDNGC